MRRCIFKRDSLLEDLEEAACKVGIKDAEANVQRIRALLAETLTERQLSLFREFDDAVVTEGTLRINTALMMACGCEECQMPG